MDGRTEWPLRLDDVRPAVHGGSIRPRRCGHDVRPCVSHRRGRQRHRQSCSDRCCKLHLIPPPALLHGSRCNAALSESAVSRGATPESAERTIEVGRLPYLSPLEQAVLSLELKLALIIRGHLRRPEHRRARDRGEHAVIQVAETARRLRNDLPRVISVSTHGGALRCVSAARWEGIE